MASEVKYKKGGGNSCAGNGCSNNRRKLNEWKQTFCELHKQKHLNGSAHDFEISCG
jgi:hypothetical protein